MKKTLSFLFCLMLTALLLVACGNDSGKNPDETIDPLGSSIKTEAPATDAPETPKETKPTTVVPSPDDYDFIQKFDAPEGNPRDIIMNYMLSMAKVKWVAAEDWTTTWKGEGEFSVKLVYEKGKTYYGVPYARTNGSLDLFNQFLPSDGNFTPNSPYYEEIVGNHCSSSMVMSIQQVLNFTYSGSLKPTVARQGLLMFPEGIEVPPPRSGTNPDNWISETVFKHNGEDAIFNGYTKLSKGDILYKNIDGSGHTRFVSKVEPFYSATGKLMPARSLIYCVEQTNAWFDNNKNTTWWIDKKYTFKEVYDTFFMPVTLCIYHEENPVIEDAYIMMKGKNTADSIKKTLNGTVEATFPLNYVRITIEDKAGQVVAEHFEYGLGSAYKVNLRNFHYDLGIDKLASGTYTYNLRAGIARGGCDIEHFEFTVE